MHCLGLSVPSRACLMLDIPLMRAQRLCPEIGPRVCSRRAPCKGGAFQWVKAPPGELAPAGSNRSSHGGDEMAEAFG